LELSRLRNYLGNNFALITKISHIWAKREIDWLPFAIWLTLENADFDVNLQRYNLITDDKVVSTFLASVKRVVNFPDVIRETNHVVLSGGNASGKGSYVGRTEGEPLSFFSKN
jgi:hypothetical protein